MLLLLAPSLGPAPFRRSAGRASAPATLFWGPSTCYSRRFPAPDRLWVRSGASVLGSLWGLAGPGVSPEPISVCVPRRTSLVRSSRSSVGRPRIERILPVILAPGSLGVSPCSAPGADLRPTQVLGRASWLAPRVGLEGLLRASRLLRPPTVILGGSALAGLRVRLKGLLRACTATSATRSGSCCDPPGFRQASWLPAYPGPGSSQPPGWLLELGLKAYSVQARLLRPPTRDPGRLSLLAGLPSRLKGLLRAARLLRPPALDHVATLLGSGRLPGSWLPAYPGPGSSQPPGWLLELGLKAYSVQARLLRPPTRDPGRLSLLAGLPSRA
ncbi:hypothetical protein BSL78_12957 [Apostichopus japonicus]|uniref:Uncharacterized protein n=1 Tax=Stichopus japonicus TaxID=307972 RepID=A0A2G8KQ91_STIJA|nr:hypothetical protein BSL78_12957 [Apostichopus japonicus]